MEVKAVIREPLFELFDEEEDIDLDDLKLK